MNINYIICIHIAKWIAQAKSNRDFALNHNIDEKIVRKILDKKEYHIPLETLIKICESRQMKLSTFFKEIQM
jgi:DNA-binding Xre family transcriptional regulator